MNAQHPLSQTPTAAAPDAKKAAGGSPADKNGLPAGLPNPLLLASGEKVTSPQMWQQKKRPELLQAFQTLVYGRAPIGRVAKQSFHVDSVTPGMMNGSAIRQLATLALPAPGGKSHTVPFTVFLPSASARPCAAFVFICNRPVSNIDPTRKVQSPFWPVEAIIARGYAAVAFQVDDFDPDDPKGYGRGVRALFDGGKRGPDAWGTIAAWSWGASRIMDYLETLPAIDAKRVAVIGHSRGGKAALWCGAQDTRFALTISNSSGSTGAALARGKTGEHISDINKHFPHWFCDNYKQFNDRETTLPIDQHELLALLAPRTVYVASKTGDAWADPHSEFLSCVAAEPVFRLFGKKGLGADKMPPPEKPLQTGSIGYHLQTGKHDLTPWDWARYMDFADTHLRP